MFLRIFTYIGLCSRVLEVPRVNIFLVERWSDLTTTMTVKWMPNGDGIINVSMMMMGTMMRRHGLIKGEREKRWLCRWLPF